MRIVNISALYPPYVIGGAELACHNVSTELAKCGHEVHVITLQPPAVKVEEAFLEGVHVHFIPLANLYWPYDATDKPTNSLVRLAWHLVDSSNFTMARRVGESVAKLRPDIVITHNLQGFSSAILPAIKKHNVPLVHVLHDFSLLCVRTALYKNSRRCDAGSKARCTDCRALTRPRKSHSEAIDSVIAVSRFALEKHRAHGLFQDVPARVVPNALRSDLSYAPDAKSAPLTNRLRFGFLGRIDKPKGIETLLRATHALENSGRDFDLIVAGSVEKTYQHTLQQRWPSTRIQFVGFVSPQDLFSQIDVLVFPSESYETFGSVVVESYSQGVPVIASRSGGTTDTVLHGRTGFLTEPGDSAGLAWAMEQFLQDHRLLNTFARNALNTESNYSASVQADRYLAAIEDTLTGFIE